MRRPVSLKITINGKQQSAKEEEENQLRMPFLNRTSKQFHERKTGETGTWLPL